MVSAEVMLSAVLVAFLTCIFLWKTSRSQRLISQIPTAGGLPFFKKFFEILGPKEELLPKMLQWTQQTGPIMQLEFIGFRRVVLTGPEEISVLLNCKENLGKDDTYNYLNLWLGTGLLTSPGHKWRVRRRLLNPAFHYKILEDFVDVFNANSAILVDKLSHHTEDQFVEINEPVALCALDIICETAMGTSVHAQRGEGVEYVRAVAKVCEQFLERVFRPWLMNDHIYFLTASGREHKKTVKVLQDFSSAVIKKQRSIYQDKKQGNISIDTEERKRKSFMDVLFEIADAEGSWTEEDIREEVNTFMFAGHDTTAAAISWALFLLGAHQDVQDKVVSELSSIFGSDDRQPTMADLQNMAYLDQVIREALRLFPSVPTYSRVLSSDLQIGKYIIPSGNNVGVFVYGLHRNPDIYPDPERFDPERFSPEQTANRHSYAFLPFSAGSRNCIGQKFSRLEEKAVLSAVLRKYKLTSLDTMSTIRPIADIVLKPNNNIRIHISKRP